VDIFLSRLQNGAQPNIIDDVKHKNIRQLKLND